MTDLAETAQAFCRECLGRKDAFIGQAILLDGRPVETTSRASEKGENEVVVKAARE